MAVGSADESQRRPLLLHARRQPLSKVAWLGNLDRLELAGQLQLCVHAQRLIRGQYRTRLVDVRAYEDDRVSKRRAVRSATDRHRIDKRREWHLRSLHDTKPSAEFAHGGCAFVASSERKDMPAI